VSFDRPYPVGGAELGSYEVGVQTQPEGNGDLDLEKPSL